MEDKTFLDREELIKRVSWYEKKYGSYVEKRGVGNFKNLFKMPTMNEWIIFFMIIIF